MRKESLNTKRQGFTRNELHDREQVLFICLLPTKKRREILE